MPLGDHAAHWANYLGEPFCSCPCLPVLLQMSLERKAGVMAKIGTQFDLRPHMESDRWPQIYAGIQQHLQKIYNGKKAALKEKHWIPDSNGTYNLTAHGHSAPPPCTHSSDIAKLKKREKVLTRQVNMFMKLFRSDDKFSQMLSQLESQPEIGGGCESGGCGDDEQGDNEDDGEDGEDEDDN
ncbi:hypothetical protein Tco_0752588 [Tanacetum coccineum]|uniref:Uncharacterized protein n=1 Tax=Tanacetum coccineum TaxID=301880 RepID=A0ABQ4ZA45_9ASTR